jgi:outer membrane protein insertion porin family
MNPMKISLLLILISSLLWAGCGSARHVPKGDKLYMGATVNVSGPSLSVRQKKELKEDLSGLTRPKANTRLFGMAFKLGIYNLFYKAKKGLFKNLRDKMGEPPVLLSQVDLQQNVKVLQNYLENKGYFHATVTGDTVVRRKKASAVYKAKTGDQYSINNVEFPQDSSDLSRAIAATAKNTLLKKGAPFDLEIIRGERTRIDALLKEKGFYFFSPDDLLIKTDSTIGNHLVNMYLTVKSETPEEAKQIYRINDVYIYGNYSLNTARLDTLPQYDTVYKGYHIIDKDQKFKPYLFEESMQFQPGDVYNRTDHNQTLNRLVNLNIFKFVKNRFEVAATDSPRLNAYYYLTPLPFKSLRGEITTVNRSNNMNGTELNVSWQHRNMFRSGAQTNISAYYGTDVQFSGSFAGHNTTRMGAEAVFTIPRFVVPRMNLRKAGAGPYAPRSLIRLGYDVMNRQGLYTLNSYHSEYGYNWKKSLQVSHELYPISITYAQPLNVTEEYYKLADSIGGLTHIIDQQFILGARYEYLLNQQASSLQKLNSFFFNGNVDVSGNIAGLITGANIKKGDTAKLFGTPFSQYVKLAGDLRYYRRIGLKSVWANRIFLGLGMPYGNSVQIPYIKQYFIGGNNSLRGFRSRSVGPGTYYPTTHSGQPSEVIPDQTGDLKLELNTEFRPHISGPLYGALFIEGGNIWLWNDSSYTHKPGSQFTSKFLSQLAVDAGVGLRLDITIFVIRLDVAFPLRKPWEIPPSVLNDINFHSSNWRNQNVVYNLAIGYPF